MNEPDPKWQGAEPPQAYMNLGAPWRVEIEPLLLGQARIIVTDGFNVEYAWMYEHAFEAAEALGRWCASGFQDEPKRWTRAQGPFGVAFRRDGGDSPSKY